MTNKCVDIEQYIDLFPPISRSDICYLHVLFQQVSCIIKHVGIKDIRPLCEGRCMLGHRKQINDIEAVCEIKQKVQLIH